MEKFASSAARVVYNRIESPLVRLFARFMPHHQASLLSFR
jgi:hypothetical protein